MIHDDGIWLSRRTIVRVLAATTLFLLIVSMGGQVIKHVFGHPKLLGLIPLFYVDWECNIPTFFSGLLLLCASLLLALIAVLKRRSSDARWRQWAILSFLFLSMAVDETSHIHELLKTPGRWLLGPMQKGIFTYAWVIFGIPTVIIVAISYLKFYLHLDPQMKTQFTIAAITFVSGALGMELVGAYYYGLHGDDNITYAMLATVEEGLEMAGIIVFINALMNYVIDHYEIRLRFDHFK